jgi:biopolymer transport protein ExbD
MSTGGGTGIKAEPNVTPMIDVMLVLLIIFMIIIPQVNAGFAAVPPQGVNLKPHPEEDQDQVLGIDAQGNYYLNRAMIRKDQLEAELKRIYEARTEDKILYVKAHRELEYDKVLEALDLAAANGVRVTGMITEQVAGTEQLVAEGQTVDPSVRPGGTQ